MIKKLVIFDFDGVIADSFDAWHKIHAYAFKKALGKTFTREQYKDCFLDELNKGFRKFAGSATNYQKLNDFKNAHREVFSKYFLRMKLFAFVKILLLSLKKIGVKLVIVTSSTNPSGTVKLLKKFKLDENFATVLFSEGNNKIGRLRKILKKFKFSPQNTYFVTDTYNDIKWGNKIGINTIGVLWGFHDRKTLIKAKPNFIAGNYKDIIKITK